MFSFSGYLILAPKPPKNDVIPQAKVCVYHVALLRSVFKELYWDLYFRTISQNRCQIQRDLISWLRMSA